jgi:hypothetical protein
MPVSNNILNSVKNTKGEIKIADLQNSTFIDFLSFDFNPTEIAENRAVKYNFSESQGQVLPHAQFGMVENTELSFTLKFFHHGGLKEQLSKVRQLTLPRELNRLSYYDQTAPQTYYLNLHDYGSFFGVFTSVNIRTVQYHKLNMLPINMDVDVTFIEVSSTPQINATRLSRRING